MVVQPPPVNFSTGFTVYVMYVPVVFLGSQTAVPLFLFLYLLVVSVSFCPFTLSQSQIWHTGKSPTHVHTDLKEPAPVHIGQAKKCEGSLQEYKHQPAKIWILESPFRHSNTVFWNCCWIHLPQDSFCWFNCGNSHVVKNWRNKWVL